MWYLIIPISPGESPCGFTGRTTDHLFSRDFGYGANINPSSPISCSISFSSKLVSSSSALFLKAAAIAPLLPRSSSVSLL